MPTDKFSIDNWSTQMRKGLLELCLFNILSEGKMYGYDLVKRISETPGMVVSEGTVYPLLSRLRKTGLIDASLEESPNGPARKYYRLTADGRKALNSMNSCWIDISKGISKLIKA